MELKKSGLARSFSLGGGLPAGFRSDQASIFFTFLLLLS
jgi:hypothetical protein